MQKLSGQKRDEAFLIKRSQQVVFHAKGSFLHFATLILTFVCTVAFVGPSGNFPLNDDWSWAIATRTLVATGMWRPTGWTSMPLISNALWAAPFCYASQCSFNDLRLTTLLASLLLLSATFFLVRLNSKETALPLAAALLVAFNPVAYALSFTFMTDIFFSTLVTISALLFVLSLEQDSLRLALVGTTVALAATLSRQLGLCIPAAYLIVRILQPGNWRHKLTLALLPLLVCAASLALYDGWLSQSGKLPALYSVQSAQIAILLKSPINLASQISRNLIPVFLYLGLFSLPILLLTRRPPVVAEADSWVRRIPFVTQCVVTVAAIRMLATHGIMPIGGNMLIPQGIGPLTLRDTYILHLPNVAPLPSAFWIAVTWLSVWGAFELAGRLTTYAVNLVATQRYTRFEPGEAGVLFVLIAIFAYLIPLMLVSIFDRYLIPVLPLILFVLSSISSAKPVNQYRVAVATILGLLIGIYAVFGVHDYMAWNRARWAAIDDLEKAGIANHFNLDGGFEYNGMSSYSSSYKKSGNKSWWWIDRDDYQISFGPIPGMKVLKRYPYETLLPPARRTILVLSK
ncbi:MAG: hypothetical protein ACYC5H_14580 [Methylovirgula sp.]